MASHHECSWIKWILKGAIAVITFTTAKLFRQQYIPNQVQIHEKLNWNANKIVTKYYRLHLVFKLKNYGTLLYLNSNRL